MSEHKDQEQVVVAASDNKYGRASTASSIDVPKLTGKNYLNWKSIMGDLITLRGYDSVVFQGESNSLLNLHAKLLIKSALDDAHLAEVRNYESAHEIWNHPSRMCIGTNSSDVAMLVRKFYAYEYQEGDSISNSSREAINYARTA